MSGSSGADVDPLKLFRDMKLPSMPDMDAVLATYRRNLEVLSQANRVALEGAQAVARRHMEILQQTMGELTETMQQLTALESPPAKAAKQAELLKQAYERAVSNTRELRDLIQQANAEALDLLNRRFLEAMDEIKALMQKAGAGENVPGR
jgi:phasin family protein